MRRRIPPIHERVEGLKPLVKVEREVRKRQRLEMLYLLRTGQATTRQQVAPLPERHRHSVGSWLSADERGGLEQLCTLKKAPGKRPWLSSAALEVLQARLAQPEGFSSFKQIQQDLAKQHQVQLSIRGGMHWCVIRGKPSRRLPVPPRKKRSCPGTSLGGHLLSAGRRDTQGGDPGTDSLSPGATGCSRGKSLWTLPLAATSHPLARRATQSFGERSGRLSRPGWCGRTCHRSTLPAGTSSQECSLLPGVPRRGCRS